MEGCILKYALGALPISSEEKFPMSEIWSYFGDRRSCTIYGNYGKHISCLISELSTPQILCQGFSLSCCHTETVAHLE